MQALRIFANVPPPSRLHRPGREAPPLVKLEEPSTEIPAQLELEPGPAPEPEPIVPIDAEPAILDILASPPRYGETIDAAYRRKESELAAILVALPPCDARALHRRLSEPRAEDTLATRFSRLVVDRRTRLLAILADAPRREARRR